MGNNNKTWQAESEITSRHEKVVKRKEENKKKKRKEDDSGHKNKANKR